MSNDALLSDVQAAAELLELPRSERVRRLGILDPFEYQADVLDCAAPNVLWLTGRQVGKTETAAALVADAALTRPGEDVLVCARFQEAADELFRRVKEKIQSLGEFDEIGVTTPNATTYEFDTGTRIMSRTLGLDGSQQRGKTPSTIVVDEAALINGETYKQVLRPMVATHDEYELVLITTPRGKSGYVYEKWNAAEDSDGWATFRNETADNPLVSDEWLEAERSEVDSTTWRQEYEGRFVESGDSYLPYDVVSPCVAAGQPERTGARCWLGVDVARSGKDRSVYISVDDDGNVFDVRSVDTETLDQAVARIKALDNQFGFRSILIDENGLGGGVVDFSAVSLGNVEPVTFSSKSKQQLYTTLKRTLESGDLTLPSNDRLVHELTSLEHSFTSTGILRVSHPAGGRDDHADALALAVHGWQQAVGPTRHEVRRRRGGTQGRRKIVRRSGGGNL